MAQTHSSPGAMVSVLPLADQLQQARTTAIIKSSQLEVIRIVLLAGKTMREHSAPGEITVQCLEGEVVLDAAGKRHSMRAGDFILLAAGAPHALEALQDSSLLLTMRLSTPP